MYLRYLSCASIHVLTSSRQAKKNNPILNNNITKGCTEKRRELFLPVTTRNVTKWATKT